nr:bifunctional diaminohydroxyphosphoribosylaminopyrimidine deaminase/5-amino-6-(5-phosphoribosylamino)uracil reductase RibD [Levilactobacillus brevis]
MEQSFMQQAVIAARRGSGHTLTNPLVGAVFVKHGQILSVGYHHRYGQQHAEIDALAQLQRPQQAQGATLYVTLEPCSHFGKTPPCADRLIEVGVGRVVIGQRDPNPLVAGRGISKLRAAGISVSVLDSTTALNPAYNFYYQHHRPQVTVKYAMSLDGKVNQAEAQRTYLTGAAAMADSQQLRRQQQAILIGERTLTIDHPRLTIRDATIDEPVPIRMVVLHDIEHIDTNQPLFKAPGPIWLLTTHPATCQLPEQVRVFTRTTWSPAAITALCYQQGIQALLVEGGSHLQAAFVRDDLADQLVIYLSPLLIGGAGLPAVYAPDWPSPKRAYTPPVTTLLGNDVKLTTRRQRKCSQE